MPADYFESVVDGGHERRRDAAMQQLQADCLAMAEALEAVQVFHPAPWIAFPDDGEWYVADGCNGIVACPLVEQGQRAACETAERVNRGAEIAARILRERIDP